MIYRVSLNYQEYDFTDPYRAIEFALTAKKHQREDKTVEVTLIKDKEESDD